MQGLEEVMQIPFEAKEDEEFDIPVMEEKFDIKVNEVEMEPNVLESQ